jgi:AcrR family transcriptional regulator
VAIELGLRERKKEKTRRLIFEVAAGLFSQSGFDEATVAEVARLADVSEPTVFKYFPTKEDLFFGGMTFFEEELLRAVRDRLAGESVIAAFSRPVVDGCRRLNDPANVELIAAAASLINGSEALRVREREIVARFTQRLAQGIAAEGGGSPEDAEAWGVASGLMGVQRALVLYVRTRVLAGDRGRPLAAGARSQAKRAFARLEQGFAGYCRAVPLGRKEVSR